MILILPGTYAGYDGFENECINCPKGYTTQLSAGNTSPDNCTGKDTAKCVDIATTMASTNASFQLLLVHLPYMLIFPSVAYVNNKCNCQHRVR